MVMAIVLSVALLLVGIAALVAVHVCLVGRPFRRAGVGFETMGGVGGVSVVGARGLSPADLEKLPCYYYYYYVDSGGGAEEDDDDDDVKGRSDGAGDCAVCLESFRMGDTCRLLPACRHSFHARCVDSWLAKRPICPVCRRVAADDGVGAGAGAGAGLGARHHNSTAGVSTAPDPSSPASHVIPPPQI
ncbi:E3 ubiquitin-protein ligase ATL23-like [Ananas comosus]|uniref:E3 ubiquitin-protein ligase ATL23-like n=1 Tax=Ananas comosus TaxID=4615 RepID=A0A199WA28_ANACO|nr:E3 ubiquitin-protein ligase ATL23-like [Ananas comosus]XP_020114082.1 E3 ubiquitin-protein ligase ATL23-like [Ananas comosus]OAY86098.1 RING-H2 finger protein ATL44 [Ananas comosus]